MNENKWIKCSESLPPIGEKVEVKGQHTLEGLAQPISYRRAKRDWQGVGDPNWRWESTEWRGTCAITRWRKVTSVKLEDLK